VHGLDRGRAAVCRELGRGDAYVLVRRPRTMGDRAGCLAAPPPGAARLSKMAGATNNSLNSLVAKEARAIASYRHKISRR